MIAILCSQTCPAGKVKRDNLLPIMAVALDSLKQELVLMLQISFSTSKVGLGGLTSLAVHGL